MSDCTHHFEHVKQTRPFTEREYMQCSKCGYQNPTGLFQHIDLTTPGTPVYAAKPGEIRATGWNATPSRSWNPALGQYPPWYAIRGGKIRTCKVWKRKDYGLFERLTHAFVPPNPWYWQCRLCGYGDSQPAWKLAYAKATHHARNHHGDKR